MSESVHIVSFPGKLDRRGRCCGPWPGRGKAAPLQPAGQRSRECLVADQDDLLPRELLCKAAVPHPDRSECAQISRDIKINIGRGGCA